MKSNPDPNGQGELIDPVLTRSRLKEIAGIAHDDPQGVHPDDIVRLIVNVSAALEGRELPFRMEDAPEYIYHYCGIDAFESIMRSGELHLGDSSFSNDEMESRWAVRQFEDILPSLLGAEAAESTLTFLAQTSQAPHIACFSSKSDMLSQWRQYASDACGFAIGIKTSMLGVHIGEPRATWSKPAGSPKQPTTIESPTSLVRVVYDHELQQNCVRQAWERTSKHPEAVARLPMLYLALRSFVPCFKHPGFREEQEWRLVGEQTVQAWPSEVNVIKSNHRKLCKRGVAPYTPFDLRSKADCLAVVRLGPRSPFTTSDILRLFEKCRWKEVPVEKSTIPYRG